MRFLAILALTISATLFTASPSPATDALVKAKSVAAKYCPDAYKRALTLSTDTSDALPRNLNADVYNMAVVRAKDCLSRSNGIRAAYLSAFTVDLMQGLVHYVDDVQANSIRQEEDRIIIRALSMRNIDSDLRDLLLDLQGQRGWLVLANQDRPNTDTLGITVVLRKQGRHLLKSESHWAVSISSAYSGQDPNEPRSALIVGKTIDLRMQLWPAFTDHSLLT